MPHKNSSQSGFTLIEVLVTILLIGATLVIYQATSKTVVVNRWNGYKEVALRIADQKMQSLRTTPFASIPATGTFADPRLADIPEGAGTITVTDLNAETKSVQVTVTWRNTTDTDTQEVRLNTYINQGGLGQ